MPGLGTIINFAAIVAGGLLGLCFAKGLSKRFQTIITIACGLSVLFMSIGDVLSHMISVDGTRIVSKGAFTIIISLVLGSITGELLNIDRLLNNFGIYLKKKSGNENEAEKFVIIVVMTSSMGIGCMFSAVPVAIFQGAFTALGFVIEPILTENSVNSISLVGSILIFCVGANLILLETESRFRFNVANMLPAIVFSVICSYLPFLE